MNDQANLVSCPVCRLGGFAIPELPTICSQCGWRVELPMPPLSEDGKGKLAAAQEKWWIAEHQRREDQSYVNVMAERIYHDPRLKKAFEERERRGRRVEAETDFSGKDGSHAARNNQE